MTSEFFIPERVRSRYGSMVNLNFHPRAKPGWSACIAQAENSCHGKHESGLREALSQHQRHVHENETAHSSRSYSLDPTRVGTMQGL